MERFLEKTEIREIRQDHDDSRRFIREISLKLRRRHSQEEETASSLYEFIINQE